MWCVRVCGRAREHGVSNVRAERSPTMNANNTRGLWKSRQRRCKCFVQFSNPNTEHCSGILPLHVGMEVYVCVCVCVSERIGEVTQTALWNMWCAMVCSANTLALALESTVY